MADEPGKDAELSGQAVHAVEFIWFWYVPAEQAVQLANAVPPVTVRYVPMGHAVGVAVPVDEQ